MLKLGTFPTTALFITIILLSNKHVLCLKSHDDESMALSDSSEDGNNFSRDNEIAESFMQQFMAQVDEQIIEQTDYYNKAIIEEIDKHDKVKVYMTKDTSSVEYQYRTLYSMFIYDLLLEMESICLENVMDDVYYCNFATYAMVAKIKKVVNLNLRERISFDYLLIKSVVKSVPSLVFMSNLLDEHEERIHKLIEDNGDLIDQIKKAVEINPNIHI